MTAVYAEEPRANSGEGGELADVSGFSSPEVLGEGEGAGRVARQSTLEDRDMLPYF